MLTHSAFDHKACNLSLSAPTYRGFNEAITLSLTYMTPMGSCPSTTSQHKTYAAEKWRGKSGRAGERGVGREGGGVVGEAGRGRKMKEGEQN